MLAATLLVAACPVVKAPCAFLPADRELIRLPGCLTNTRDLALVSKTAEADTADPVLTEISMGATTEFAPVVGTGGELRGSLLLQNHRFLSHVSSSFPYFANGAPIRASSSLASSSVLAVVTNTISIPRILSTLSYSISGKISCSRRPSE